jgi:uncharacterized membrane protein
MTKKTILVLTIIVALIIAIYKWLTTSDNEQKQPVEETKAENNEKENVKPETNAEEVKNGNDTVNENHK